MMNSRILAYQLARYHQRHQRRPAPVVRRGADCHAPSSVGGQSDWAAFLRLAIVLALTGCAIAMLHLAHQS